MASRRISTWPALAIIVGLSLAIIALPQGARMWAPGFLRAPMLHFGLDLAGGTQLDFRISEKEVQDQIKSLEKEIAQMEA